MSDYKTIFASAARTATVTSDKLNVGDGIKSIKIVIDCTVDAAAASHTPTVDYFDPASEKWINLITGAATAAVGTVVLSVGANLTASANVVVKDDVPSLLRVKMTAADTDAITYSVGLIIIR